MGAWGLAALPSLIAGFRVAFTGIKIFIVKAFSEAFAYAQTQANLVANHSKQVHNEAEEANTQTTNREVNERSAIEK
jgi:hypothetical protein